MKKYVIIGIVVLVIIGGASYALLASSGDGPAVSTTQQDKSAEKDTQDTQQSSSQIPTNTTQDTGDTGDTTSTENSVEVASYSDYVLADVVSSKDKTRVLFFYSKDHEQSKTLDALLDKSIRDFPKDVRIYKVDYDTEKDLAAELSVSQPGTALKYEDGDQLTGIYVTNDSPEISSFREILSLK